MRRITIGLALLIGAMVALPATASADQEVCRGLDSGKINTTDEPAMVTMTAPAGNLITQYCVKAGSDESADGAVSYVTVAPPAASITVPHPSGKSVSHYSFAWAPIVEETTTTTATTTTTVPVEETTTTTTEVEEQEAVTTTSTEEIVAVEPPSPPAVSPAPESLPSTGSSSWTIVFIAISALGAGLGLMRIARRDDDELLDVTL